MGITKIDLSTCTYNEVTKNIFPEAYKLSLNVGTDCGEILVAVGVYDKTLNFNLPRNFTIETNRYHFDMNILGIRGLISTGILPIKKS